MQTMPFLAILRYELRSLWTSWLVRLWLVATAIVTLLTLAASWGQLQTAPFVAALLFPYLVFPWSLVVMVLGISPVTGSRLDALADGILSRPVTRYEYLLASWAARVMIVLGIFLVVVVPIVSILAVAERKVAEDEVTLYGIIASLSVVGLVLTFLVSLAFFVGTLLRRPMLATVVLIFFWFPVNGILNNFSLEEFSPISLNQALPTLLRTPWHTSSTEDSENKAGKTKQEIFAQEWDVVMKAFSGESRPRAKPESGGFYSRDEDYKDFSLLSVILGYGLPTLAAVSLATLCFCRRDL